MRRLSLFVCGFALLSAAPLSAQESPLPKQFQNWKLANCAPKPVVDSSAIWNEAGIREYGDCQFKSGDKVVEISGGRYRDPSSAFEVYTTYLRAGMVPTNLGQVSAFDKDGVIILEGTLVLSSTANVSKDDLSALVKAVEAGSEKGPLPPVRTYLPKTGRVLGTERYALGPEAMSAALADVGQGDTTGLIEASGVSHDDEVMVARYSLPGKGTGVLLLIEYPTPQLAEQHIHHLEEVLSPAAIQAGSAIERKGSLLKIVLAPSSAEYAKQLREAVDYETQVTWNEASQTATDPPITSIMVKIFIGTGVFMVAAVVLGIAFGGVRVLTKRFFPGKVFDRPEQIEVLQLGLSGKRIDPSDFY
jgi:hypothetical protein